MLSFLACALLLVQIAIGLELTERTVTIQTDDRDQLSKMNISHLFRAMESEESRQLSFDGTGLRLKGIYFHQVPPHMRAKSEQDDSSQDLLTHLQLLATSSSVSTRADGLASSKATAFETRTSAARLAARTAVPVVQQPQCYPSDGLGFVNQDQANWIAGPACKFISSRVVPSVAGSIGTVIWDKAWCQFKGQRVNCDIIGGSVIGIAASYLASDSLFFGQCDKALDNIAQECAINGGSSLVQYQDTDGKDQFAIDYFAYPAFSSQSTSGFCDPSQTTACDFITCAAGTGVCET